MDGRSSTFSGSHPSNLYTLPLTNQIPIPSTSAHSLDHLASYESTTAGLGAGPDVNSREKPKSKGKAKRKETSADAPRGGRDVDDHEGVDELPDEDGDESKARARKRNRMALSCTECKRRKIRCDRKTPCEACCKRGEESTCHWEVALTNPAPQPFALATEHELLKRRVAYLEDLVLRNHHPNDGNVNGQAYDAYQLSRAMSHYQDGAVASSSGYRNEQEMGVGDLAEPDSDTEDAALVLEELALGRKLTRVGKLSRKLILATPSPAVSRTPPSPAVPLRRVDVILSNPVTQSLDTPSTLPPLSRAMASLLVQPPEARKKLVLDDIWRNLPSSKPTLDWLVANYFTNTDWAWKLHDKPTFLAEYEAFSQLVISGRKDEIDPLWLGIFCMTLCLSVNSLEGRIESPLVNITDNDLALLPGRFFEAAQGCLEVGDWTGKPRIRTLQTIVLFAPFLLFDGTPSTGERHQTYLGAAIRIAQQLGLHQLGHDPNTMPSDDPALPPGINTRRREVPIRLFYTLLFLDYMGIRSKPGLPPNLVDCALPGNYNDTDLSSEGIVPPRPDDQSTDVSFEVIKYKVALQQRRFSEIVGAGATLEYETIIDLDAGYRSIMEGLPLDLRHDYEAPLGEDLGVGWRRAMVTQNINNRLMRLHRPFMSRGYREPKYQLSTTRAISAARSVLACQQALYRAPLLKAGFQLLHVQGALIVIFMNVWTEFPENLEQYEDYRLIRDAIPFFERSLISRHLPVRKIAQQNLQTLELLIDAFEKRREAAEARKAAGGTWESEVEAESYGRLLKRVGTVVVSTASTLNSEAPESQSALSNGASGAISKAFFSSAIPPTSGGMTLDWTSAGGIFTSISADATNVMGPSYLPEITLSDLDLTSLSGPEYSDPNFDWLNYNALDQFAAMGSF